jgi:hypothetical protein
MYETEKNAFLQRYEAVSDQLYRIAVLVTGKPDLAVPIVQNAVVECYRSTSREPFESKIYRFLWNACECCDPLWGYHYRKNICALNEIDVDQGGCPALIDALSKREKEERMVLAMMILANRTPEQIAPLFEVKTPAVERALKKICKGIHFNVAS